MTDTSKPLPPSELADLKAKAKAATPELYRELAQECVGDLTTVIPAITTDKIQSALIKTVERALLIAANPETVLRLVDMIERRDEQIVKLRETMKHFAKVGFDKAREALAATEPSDG